MMLQQGALWSLDAQQNNADLRFCARAHVRTCARADRLALWSEYELKEFLLDKKTTTISHASPKLLLRKSSIFLYLLQIVVKELVRFYLHACRYHFEVWGFVIHRRKILYWRAAALL